MSRLEPLQDADMTPQQVEFAEAVRARRATGPTAGVLPPPQAGLGGPLEALLRSPELGFRYRELAAWAFGVSSMPRDLVEFAILLCLKHWNAQFPFWAHVLLGRQAGLADEVMEAIRLGTPIPFVSSDMRLLHDFLTQYLDGNRVTDAVYEELRGRIGESGVVDLVGLMGVYAATAMVANVFEVAIPGQPDDLAIEPS